MFFSIFDWNYSIQFFLILILCLDILKAENLHQKDKDALQAHLSATLVNLFHKTNYYLAQRFKLFWVTILFNVGNIKLENLQEYDTFNSA